jgi:hypothetical protein
MPVRTSAARWIAVATAAVTMGAVGLSAAPAAAADSGPSAASSAGSPAPRHGELHLLETMTSFTVVDEVAYYSYSVQEAPAGPTVGDIVGSCHLLYVRPSDNHAFTSCDDVITLPDGAMRTFGVIDQTETFQGLPVTLHVRGLAGAYQHLTGIRSWQSLAPGLVLAKSDIVFRPVDRD